MSSGFVCTKPRNPFGMPPAGHFQTITRPVRYGPKSFGLCSLQEGRDGGKEVAPDGKKQGLSGKIER